MTDSLAFLINLLEDEFRGFPEIRVRPVFRSTTQRAPDLVQDYDPGASDLHLRSGVTVQTPRRQYFFPENWLSPSLRTELDRQIQEIRDAC